MNIEAYNKLVQECKQHNVTLVAVSKTKPVEDILALYNLGQRDFGENYVQEFIEKQQQLPKDIRWHFIGHLQTNKVKQIVGIAALIHGVDSFKLLKEINKQSAKINVTTTCLLQIHIAQEETKFGLDEEEANALMRELENLNMNNVNIAGLMGMASFTNDENQIRKEFQYLKSLQSKLSTANCQLSTLSMGMTADYTIAIEEGSTMIRVGSLIFGERKPTE
ncbi:YggS family pyridoxal phosphate-dependent enzyme [Parafilimonas sp.]|uniref:YggS family pyridoxal phosphate-dependent enzyme n=1 Tax=Parafilimonas sp. TaxID=1969739 RepID=UPI003F7EC4AF